MELKFFLSKLLSNPVTVIASILVIGGYVLISSYIAGKWVFTNQKFNSNTKKAKKIVKFGVGMWITAIILFSIVIPFMSFSDGTKNELQNPYLGNWIIETSPIEVIPNLSRINFYISDRNQIKGIIKSVDGKELGFFSHIKLNHYDYSQIQDGRFNSNYNTKFDFKSEINSDNQSMRIEFYEKTGEEIGIMKIKK